MTMPITLDEAKIHLRVIQTDEDSLIEQLIKAATEHAENFQQRCYINATKVFKLDKFPDEIRPPWSPLVKDSVEIEYIDIAGVTKTLSEVNYDVDTYNEPGRITPAYTKTWPATRDIPNAVIVNYTAGYGAEADTVPDNVKAAIKLLVGHLYEHRESITEITLAETPQAFKSLLWPRRVF